MSERSKKAIELIQKAGTLAGNSNIDFNRKEMERLHKQTQKKTYEQFVESFTPERFTKSYGSPAYQKELEKQRRKRKEEREAEIAANNAKATESMRRGKGIPAIERGVKGHIKNGVFTPGEWY
jgi:hypothetical protein